ncbi:phosphoribosylformylglycinamidine cyclo-ligase [Blattabacterium cuenoti]|uniref:phosphoribosylformylglycinamidine cyclo-ligase n=1 Tax=Blattabacterium cuenoti TaxID=1653831 RepID=UPI00163C026D|nr:phosphoribosylformylglycinamidine cyclo-ligase [Blattabacterium cuenoti]
MKENYIAINKISKILKNTYNYKVLSTLEDFSAFYKIHEYIKYKKPILVSGVDGVGTKLRLSLDYKKYDVIGKDCFAMCINDILCHGATPLFFLDYLACEKLDFNIIEKIIEGISVSCKENNTCFIGGETAEMTGFYKRKNDYDISGFCVGIVEEDNIINGKKLIKENDILIGIPSSGVHSNGFSLIRKIFSKEDFRKDFKKKPLYETLLNPTRIYYKIIYNLLKKFSIHGIAHITGGGILNNLCRIIPNNLSAIVKIDQIPINFKSIFEFIQKKGNLSDEIMLNTFNMGVGIIIVVSSKEVNLILDELHLLRESPFIIGNIVKGSKKVFFK